MLRHGLAELFRSEHSITRFYYGCTKKLHNPQLKDSQPQNAIGNTKFDFKGKYINSLNKNKDHTLETKYIARHF